MFGFNPETIFSSLAQNPAVTTALEKHIKPITDLLAQHVASVKRIEQQNVAILAYLAELTDHDRRNNGNGNGQLQIPALPDYPDRSRPPAIGG